jgi:hypothetical protein
MTRVRRLVNKDFPLVEDKAIFIILQGHDMEITSGGSGSSDECCCGVTLGVHGGAGDGEGYRYRWYRCAIRTGSESNTPKYTLWILAYPF